MKAVGTVLQDVSWQRCRVHFMRNVLAKVSTGHDKLADATICTMFAQPGQDGARAPADLVASMLAGSSRVRSDMNRPGVSGDFLA